MIEIVNLQQEINLDLDDIRSFERLIISMVTESDSRRFSVAFISDNRMKKLNEQFRGENQTTDVLSFPHQPDEFDPDKENLGDIVISVEQAQRQATENGLTLNGELKQLILHGLLHLCGYDHETDDGEMNTRELELREKLNI